MSATECRLIWRLIQENRGLESGAMALGRNELAVNRFRQKPSLEQNAELFESRTMDQCVRLY